MSSSSASGRSFGAPSRPRRMASRQTAQALSRSNLQAPSRSRKLAPEQRSQQSGQKLAKKPGQKPGQKLAKKSAKKPLRAPRPIRRFVRWLVLGPQKSPRKVLMAGGSVATLAALVIVPTRAGSQQVALSSCQEVVKSGAEISRAQLASLLAVPEGSRHEAVRQAIDVPYCLLPSQKASANKQASEQASEQTSELDATTAANVTAPVTTREAYPLAFDPEAWVVVRYAEGEYVGYDFVFKP